MKKSLLLNFAFAVLLLIPCFQVLGFETEEDVATVDADQQVVLIDVTANDSGAPETAQVTSVVLGEAEDGTVELVGDYVVFTPSITFDGFATVTYEICDNGSCESELLTIEEGINTTPHVEGETVAVLDEVPSEIDVISNDEDPNGDTLIVASILDQPDNGTVEIVDNILIYTANEGFAGIDAITYQVCDPAGACSSADVTIAVTDGNASKQAKIRRAHGGFNYCGDGRLVTAKGEECDDGNAKNGDGCSSNCRIEQSLMRKVQTTVTQTQKTQTKTTKHRFVNIDALLAPYLNENENRLLAAIQLFTNNKTPYIKARMYKRVMDRFPTRAYTKYKIRQNYIEIILRAKIDANTL